VANTRNCFMKSNVRFTAASGWLQRLVRSAVACIDSVMMYPQPPNSDEPCSTCGGKGYRPKCGCWRKQDGKGGDTEKKSAAEANSHEQAGISLLVLWGEACQSSISDRRWDTDDEQAKSDVASSLGNDPQNCGSLKARICPHELAELLSLASTLTLIDLTR